MNIHCSVVMNTITIIPGVVVESSNFVSLLHVNPVIKMSVYFFGSSREVWVIEQFQDKKNYILLIKHGRLYSDQEITLFVLKTSILFTITIKLFNIENTNLN